MLPSTFNFEGFIIGYHERKESDALVSLLTKKRGRLRVLARGLKKITSKRMGVLETGNLVKGTIFVKGDFFVLGEVELIFQPLKARKDLVGCGMLLTMCELIERFLPEQEGNPLIFQLFWETLLHLSKKPRIESIETMINFEVKLLQLLGYGLPQRIIQPLKEKNWKIAQTEIWRYFNIISERELIGLGKILG